MRNLTLVGEEGAQLKLAVSFDRIGERRKEEDSFYFYLWGHLVVYMFSSK